MHNEPTNESVVRHYRGATRAAAEHAYRNDATQAFGAGYVPVAHRWSEDWSGHTLSVAYRLEAPSSQAAMPAPASTAAASPAPAPPAAVVDQGPEAPALPAAEVVEQELQARAPPPAEVAPPPAAEVVVPPPLAETVVPPPEQARTADLSTPPVAAPQVDSPAPQPPSPEIGAHPSARPAGRRMGLTIETLDMHCAGEPLRIVRSGFPEVPSAPVLERRRWVGDNADHIRRAIVHEPRGHRDMYAAVLLPPYARDADVCLLFMHNEGYSTMCGHGVIAVTAGLIEEGLYPASEPLTTIRYEVPAGIVTASASTTRHDDGSWSVEQVRFTNVPAYLHARTLAVRPDGVELHEQAAEIGQLSVDLSFGGAYYGIVDAAELGLRVVPEQAEELRRAGAAITEVLRRDHQPSHPTDAELGFVYGTIIVDRDPPGSPDGRAPTAHLRNATIFADAELDRSPCGSGTSAILAQLHARGHLRPGHEIANAGITGEVFLGRVESETLLGSYPAVVTSVAGTAYVVGYSTLVVDERDPLGGGFVLR